MLCQVGSMSSQQYSPVKRVSLPKDRDVPDRTTRVTRRLLALLTGASPTWAMHIYLVDRKGKLLRRMINMSYSRIAVSCLLGLLITQPLRAKAADVDYNHDKHHAFSRHLLYS